MTPRKSISPATPDTTPGTSPETRAKTRTKPSGKPSGSAAFGVREKANAKRNPWRTALNIFVLIINILVAICLTVCAFSGKLNPLSHPYAVLPAMVFPIALIAAGVILILDLIWWRRISLVLVAALLICIVPVLNYCPLNLPKRSLSDEQKKHSFTLMTYNVMAFQVQTGVESTTNPQISYILEQDPDVVCIQEYMLMMKNKRTRVKQAQVDSLTRRYPYFLANSYLQAIFSKYPVEAIPLDFVNAEGKGDIAAWRLNIDDRVVNVFSVHLRSLYFTVKDKRQYEKMFNPDSINRSRLSWVKSGLLRKIVDASQLRALQLDSLKRYVKKYGGANAIVCGDFNEPVGCWGLHTLEHDCRLQQVYPEVGFGPMITYNANRFWVRIDHVLYRGNLEPRYTTRGSLRASDHYPLTTLFYFKPDEDE